MAIALLALVKPNARRMTQGFALTVAQLGGQAPPPRLAADPAGRQRAAAARLQHAARVLRAEGGDDCRAVADALEAYLADGGKLEALLGFSRRRGGGYDSPHQLARKARKLKALEHLAAGAGDATARARVVARKLLERPPEVLALHETHGVRAEDLPTSIDRIATLLRESR